MVVERSDTTGDGGEADGANVGGERAEGERADDYNVVGCNDDGIVDIDGGAIASFRFCSNL